MGVIWIIFFSLKICLIACQNEETAMYQDQDMVETVRKHGYPIEVHEVETEDGYILTIHRIPHGRANPRNTTNKHPVLINHPLLSNSWVFIMLGPQRSMAYVLADNGYDVWLMNSRDTPYSRHKVIRKDQKEFWNFTLTEISIYDQPACLDYVLKMTNRSRIHCVGHSQSTTTFLIMGSERPEHNHKIKLLVGLAPSVSFKHIPNKALVLANYLLDFLKGFAAGFDEHMLPPPSAEVIRIMGRKLCVEPGALRNICHNFLRYFTPNIYFDDVKDILGFAPTTFSARQVFHFGQMSRDKRFQYFDFDPETNKKLYNSETPPLYNIKRVSFPIALFQTDTDEFSRREDLFFLENGLNLVGNYIIGAKQFSHLEFVLAGNLKRLLYPWLLKSMNAYKNKD